MLVLCLLFVGHPFVCIDSFWFLTIQGIYYVCQREGMKEISDIWQLTACSAGQHPPLILEVRSTNYSELLPPTRVWGSGCTIAPSAHSSHLTQVLARHRVSSSWSCLSSWHKNSETIVRTIKLMAKLKVITGSLCQGLSRWCRFSSWLHHQVG